MPNPILGMMGASIGGSLLQGGIQARAAGRASDAQVQSTRLGIQEQRRQFDAIRSLMAPFIQTGNRATTAQGNLIGLNGNPAQASAIAGIQAGPEYTSMIAAGENAILQNASATGGLRGGNTQDALSRFRPEVLSSLINNQFGRLGGLSQMGQASAAGQAAAGQNMAGNVSQLFAQRGAAQAGGFLAAGQGWGNAIGNAAGAIGYGAGAFATPPGSPGGLPAGATMLGRWGF